MATIKAYRHKNGSILTQHPAFGWYFTSATPTDATGTDQRSPYSIEMEVKSGNLEEVDLAELKWIHPHLLKPVRENMMKLQG